MLPWWTRRGVVRNVDIHEDRLHSLIRNAIIGRGQVERAVKRNERVGIPGARGAGVLIIRHHPLAVELHGASFLENRRQLAFGEKR